MIYDFLNNFYEDFDLKYSIRYHDFDLTRKKYTVRIGTNNKSKIIYNIL